MHGNKTFVEISVRDTGTGIADDIGIVFNREFQQSPATTEERD